MYKYICCDNTGKVINQSDYKFHTFESALINAKEQFRNTNVEAIYIEMKNSVMTYSFYRD